MPGSDKYYCRAACCLTWLDFHPYHYARYGSQAPLAARRDRVVLHAEDACRQCWKGRLEGGTYGVQSRAGDIYSSDMLDTCVVS